MHEIDEELIHKFFSGLCTQEEAEQVLLYLKQHPGHPYLLREWEEADGTTPLPASCTEDMREAVIRHTGSGQVKRPAARWILAAASILALVLLAWFWRGGSAHAPPALVRKAPPSAAWIACRNGSREQEVVLLADSSRITLSPQAEIRYRKGFGVTAPRDVYMKGDVFYEVAKNRERPFTVYSGWISTTAVGTAFRVTAPAEAEQIKVRLNEGKVKVAHTSGRKTDYYLLPGQELVFRGRNTPGVLHSFFMKVGSRKAEAKAGKRAENRDESYLFNNQTLPDVLDQLSVMYGVRLRYAPADLERIYFVGTVTRNDSIEKTLEDIALLNRLSVRRSGTGFILESKK